MASVVARIKAIDADIGVNAEMEYKIVDGDGLEIFKISADKDTQEGIITIQKVMFPLLFLFHKGDVINYQTTIFALMQRCDRHTKCHKTHCYFNLFFNLYLGLKFLWKFEWHFQ